MDWPTEELMREAMVLLADSAALLRKVDREQAEAIDKFIERCSNEEIRAWRRCSNCKHFKAIEGHKWGHGNCVKQACRVTMPSRQCCGDEWEMAAP